jgi:anti-sigma regulatory factor (Ser/Thr protein kinase)
MSDLTAESVHADGMAYAAPGDLRAVRAFVRDTATALGLAPDRVALLILAVSELTTNTLQHTTGGGRVRLWAGPDHVMCEVVDGGPPRPFGDMPAGNAVRGRGLPIVTRIADEVTTEERPDGTVVRIRMNRVQAPAT